MKTRVIVASVVLAAAFAGSARATLTSQDVSGRQAGTTGPSRELVSACIAAQQQVVALADRLSQRLEAARQTNSPQQMRSAVEDLQAGLAEMRSRAAQCAALEAAAAPVDPHAGHAMPSSAMPVKPAAAPGAKPSTTAKPADPHAGHVMPSAGAAIDPVSGQKVDPATAVSTTYLGKTYYFASPADRLKFIKNPETYLKKEPGTQ